MRTCEATKHFLILPEDELEVFVAAVRERAGEDVDLALPTDLQIKEQTHVPVVDLGLVAGINFDAASRAASADLRIKGPHEPLEAAVARLDLVPVADDLEGCLGLERIGGSRDELDDLVAVGIEQAAGGHLTLLRRNERNDLFEKGVALR